MGPFLFLRAAAAAALPLALLLSLSVLPATALPWRAEAIPDPTKDPVGCGRPAGSKSWICDPDRLLSPAGAHAIEQALQEIHVNVTRMCGDTPQGYEVAVGLVRRMITGGEDIPEATRRFARELHNRWGVGSAECDNGVMMFLSVDDRWIHISTGKGSREALPDSAVQHAISVMRPLLRSGSLSTAILAGVQDMGAHLRQPVAAKPRNISKDLEMLLFLVEILGLVLMFLAVAFYLLIFLAEALQWIRGLWVSWWQPPKRSPRGEYRNQLAAIDQRMAAVEAGQLAATSCAICLEDFEPLRGCSRKPTRVLWCGHTFHKECLRNWGSSGRSTAPCPICSGPVGAGTRESVLEPLETIAQREASFRRRQLDFLFPAMLLAHQTSAITGSSSWAFGGNGGCGIS
eukprot:RCo036456